MEEKKKPNRPISVIYADAKHAEYDTLVAVKDCVEETLRQWQPRQLSIQFDFDPVNVL